MQIKAANIQQTLFVDRAIVFNKGVNKPCVTYGQNAGVAMIQKDIGARIRNAQVL